MTTAGALISKLVADWPPDQWRDVTVLVAVSGGADSVALAKALHSLRAAGEGRLVIAHFNHGLRGAESEEDLAFVEALGRDLGAAVVVGRQEGETERPRDEDRLREVRYRFLARAADEAGARYVATAHTADDQVETVLHNTLRGTGLAGLAGIPRVRRLTGAATLIRPLLSVTRAEVLEYLESSGQTYRIDSSNEATSYTRNRIRRELLPLLERDYNPNVRDALLRLSKVAATADDWLQHQAWRVLSNIARQIEGGVEIPLSHLRHLRSGPDLHLRYFLMGLWRQQGWPQQDMSYEKWEQLAAFARTPADQRDPPERQTYPGNVRAEKQGGVLRLTRPAS